MRANLLRRAAWLAKEARAFRSLIILVAVYWCSKLVFFYVAGRYHLFRGMGTPNLGVVALGLVVLALQLAVLIYVPLMVVYRLGNRLADRRG